MREQIETRLQQLRAELESGQRLLGELEAQQASLRSTLLRISGAMQVLEELLDGTSSVSSPTEAPITVPSVT